MASTKIINIQKNDTFDDIFDAFKNAQAQEVIFIFPRGSRFGRDDGYFQSIKDEAGRSGKAISILTGDPIVAKLASSYGFNLLESPTRRRRATVEVSSEVASVEPPEPSTALNDVTQDNTVMLEGEQAPMATVSYAPAAEPEVFAETEEETIEGGPALYDIGLAAARRKSVTANPTSKAKRVRDVLTHTERQGIEVAGEKESELFVPVKTTPRTEPSAEGTSNEHEAPQADIEKLWAEEAAKQGGTPAGGQPAHPNIRGFFSRSSIKILTVAVIVVVLAIGGVAYATLGTAQVIVHPRTKDIHATIKIVASTTATAVDTNKNVVPGQRFSVTKEANGTFPTSNEKDIAQKASGKISITNSGATLQKLIATTRFESEKGKIFRISETITVPAATKTDGVSVPGTIDVVVYADAPGPEYNIDAGKFTLPGLKGTPKFTEITGIAKTAMKGGFIGRSKTVSEQDFVSAKDSITKNLQSQISDAIKEQIGDLATVEPLHTVFEDPVVNVGVGDAADNLQMSIKATATIIAFRSADTRQIIDTYVKDNGGMELVQRDLSIQYASGSLDKETKTDVFNARITGKVATKLDTVKILKDIPGMDEQQIRDYFEKNPDVQSARILLSPFWVKKIPKAAEKIKLSITTD